jgi:hypothetical protein
MAMMAITTSNSIKVNPTWECRGVVEVRMGRFMAGSLHEAGRV